MPAGAAFDEPVDPLSRCGQPVFGVFFQTQAGEIPLVARINVNRRMRFIDDKVFRRPVRALGDRRSFVAFANGFVEWTVLAFVAELRNVSRIRLEDLEHAGQRIMQNPPVIDFQLLYEIVLEIQAFARSFIHHPLQCAVGQADMRVTAADVGMYAGKPHLLHAVRIGVLRP